MGGQVVEAQLTWTGERFERGVRLEIGDDGRFARIGAAGRAPDRRLARRALLPGFVNAHSHAFQRGLRGRGETFPAGAGSFWTWREAMYDLVASLDRDRFAELCRRAFAEMLACGMTTVGEFHYLHHDQPGDFAFDELVLEAAAEVGIRIVLLAAFYARGGFDQPLSGAQQRFATPSLPTFWRHVDRLQERLDRRTQSLGLVAHSLRAAALDDIVELHRGATERGLVLHLHVEEQRREIADCIAAHGQAPMALLNERLGISPTVTAVHCTHTDPGDMARFLAAGGNVCICPLTEANLGDGIAEVPAILDGGGHLCLGSDSNARISMSEEMRWLEYVQRLAGERRGVCRDDGGQVGRRLLEIATAGGARSLGIPAGRLAEGCWADLVAIDLEAPSLAGWSEETLLDGFVCGARDDAVAEVAVGGRWVETGNR